MASTASSCISKADALGPTSREQFDRQQRGFLSAFPPNSGDERMGGRIGELIEPALQNGSRGLGVMPRRHDAGVTEEMLKVSDVAADEGRRAL
jgi:hypothetical protein